MQSYKYFTSLNSIKPISICSRNFYYLTMGFCIHLWLTIIYSLENMLYQFV